PYGEPGRYEIVAGERRWRAAQLAGLQEIPVVIKEVSDQATMAMALIENIQRENLNPIEEATALQRLIQEFELTQQQAADAVGRSRTAVTNLLRLLHLNAEVRVLLEKSRLEMGHARALLGLQGKAQSDAAKQVVLLGLSVRETEKLVRKMLHPTKVTNKVAEEADPNVRALQNQLSEQLGATVVVKQGQKGRGQLVIQYNSLDELDGILTHIQ
ncbi:MAG TPA: ParB/RepB/Spo0J family partition protein, partial [Gammaproteobacteria bacterium]|nr:ParB/RepB/Spo0J family partition protein [Gammaproteobacteria bacterium]